MTNQDLDIPLAAPAIASYYLHLKALHVQAIWFRDGEEIHLDENMRAMPAFVMDRSIFRTRPESPGRESNGKYVLSKPMC